MKKIIYNAVGSWITTGMGVVIGVPEMWMGLSGLLDEDPATGFNWKLFVTGLAMIVMGIVARDGNKSSEAVKAK